MSSESLCKFLLISLFTMISCGSDDNEVASATVPVPDGIIDERELYTVSTLTEPFDGSGGLTVDKDGMIYVADFGDFINNANGEHVSRIDPETGQVTEYASGLVGPSGNVFSANGNLFQANIAGNFISEISGEGEVTEFVSQGLNSPVGVVFDPQGNLYACNCASQSIQIITPDRTSSRFVTSGLLRCPNGLTIDNDGRLYAANFSNGNVIKVSPDAQAEIFVTIPGGSNAHLVFKDEVIYVLSRSGNRLYKVNLEGEISLIAGTGSRGNDDGSGEVATFYIPNGIGVSPDGSKIYVVSRLLGEGTPLNPVLVRVVELK